MKQIEVFCLVASLCCPLAVADDSDSAQNIDAEAGSTNTVASLIERLTKDGIVVANQTATLSAPWLTDGMTAAEQTAVTDKLAGRRKKQFYRDSISATVESDIRSIKDGKKRNGYVVDFAFVVYGSLDDLMPDEEAKGGEGLQALAKESEMKVTQVTPETLKAAGITTASLNELRDSSARAPLDHEQIVHGTFTLLEKVLISTVVGSSAKRSDESITIAWEQDRRFHETPTISNQWQFTDRTANAKFNTYNGFAGYAKVTKLKAKEGALLVEYHYAFAEPKEWSEERISLRAKLSIVLQESVRKARRQIKNMQKQAAAKQ